MTASSDTDRARASYRPVHIGVLFVGESPPAGGTFFYKCDPWSNLGRYTRDGFARCYPEADIGDCSRFLDFYRDRGCYLDDLCHCPVDKRDRRDRRRRRNAGVQPLAERMSREHPQAVVIVMKGIRTHVRRAMVRAGCDSVPCFSLPFPTRGRQQEYVGGLADVLCELRDKGILSDP